ncbi:hypothetical protein U0070_006749 [Myodes glareolus]|uniref:Uncharacterized protein n=1 Tax=Myodes glareolus TaxID=447135 RepID=A0AAW0HHC2_MYOGA
MYGFFCVALASLKRMEIRLLHLQSAGIKDYQGIRLTHHLRTPFPDKLAPVSKSIIQPVIPALMKRFFLWA